MVPVKSKSGDEVVGTLHVALPYKLVSQVMKGVASVDGRLLLRQKAGGNLVTLNQVGRGGTGSSVDGRRPVLGTIWEVAYHLPQASMELGQRLVSLAVIGAAAVLIILLLLVQAARLKKAIKSDLVVIVDQAEKQFAGEMVGGDAVMRLSELDHIRDLLRRLGQGAARRPSRKTNDKKAAPEDAPLSTSEDGGAPGSPFGAHEIGGIVGVNMTEKLAYQLGCAIGSEAYEQGQQTVIVARDGRDSSADLSEALCKGLEASGRDVVDIGLAPTPVLYFATHFLNTGSGVMVASGDKRVEYNGMNVIIAGEALSSEMIQKLHRRIQQGDLLEGSGTRQEQSLLPDYIGRVTSDVQLARPLKVVVDCG